MTEEKRKKKKREGTVQDKRESVDCGNSETKEGKHGSLVGDSPRSPFELEPIHCSPNRLGRVEKKKEEEEEGCDSNSIIPVGVEGGGAGN